MPKGYTSGTPSRPKEPTLRKYTAKDLERWALRIQRGQAPNPWQEMEGRPLREGRDPLPRHRFFPKDFVPLKMKKKKKKDVPPRFKLIIPPVH